MDNKSFDHIVKAKLENLTSDATPRWDLFKEKRSVHDAMRADTAFDNKIRRTVSEYTAPYNSGHWDLLKARLERIYGLRKALYSIKAYELLAVLLLFYSVGNNYDYIFGTDLTASTASQPIAIADDKAYTAETYNTINTQTEESENKINNSTINNSTINNSVITSGSDQNTIKPVSTISAIDIQRSEIIKNNESSNFQNSVVSNEKSALSNSKKILNTIAENNDEKSDILSDASLQDAILNIASIAAIKSTINTVATQVSLFEDNFGIKPLNNVDSNSKWLQVAASFDNNQISTPFNENYNLGPQSSEMFGYSLSGLFSVEKGNWEYETGLTYSVYNKPMAFRRHWDNNIGDVFIYSLTNVNYDILSTPLRVKYHFATTPDWSLYVTGGLSPEFIVNTGYDENDVPMNINVPTPVGGNVKPELTEIPFRTESNFHQGLFEQGSFRDNFMLRAQIGAGMQRNITPTLSAFIAGDYYNSIINTTYGPTDDKINKFSITFGVKERF